MKTIQTHLPFLASVLFLSAFSSSAGAQKLEPIEPEPNIADLESAAIETGDYVAGAEEVYLVEEEAPADVEVNVNVHAPPAEAPRPRRPGTHFIAEQQLGIAAGDDLDLAMAGILGVGGKLRGFPLRFYAIAEFSFSFAGSEGLLATGPYEDSRSYFGMGLGLRTYIPVFGPLRLHFDLVGGAALSTASLEGFNLGTEGEEWYAMAALAAGVQFRMFRLLSVGLRVRYQFTDDPLSEFRESLGLSTSSPVQVLGGTTWHF
ncbi:MAG: hypothetical protein AAGF12_35875 [Myxococcota bacterium]